MATKYEIVKNAKGTHLEIDGKTVEGVYSIDIGEFNGHKDITIKILTDNITMRLEN